MRNFLLRVVINTFALAVIVTLLPQGIRIVGVDTQNQLATLIGIALIFGLVNAIVKPILTVLTCPFILLSLGLFLVIINGLMFLLTAELSRALLDGRGLVVDGLLWAIVGALLMGLIGVVSERLFGLDDRTRVKVKTEREVRYVYRDRDDAPSFPPPTPGDEFYDPNDLPPPGEKPKRR